MLWTGIHTGVVAVAVESHPTQPEPLTAEWDEVVEVSVEAPAGELMLVALMDDIAPRPPTLTSRPGWYRARVHARGRDLDYDGVAFEPTEDYLIQLWLGADAPDLIHKQTDDTGRIIRRTYPSPRPER
jgi:hypothetical protein